MKNAIIGILSGVFCFIFLWAILGTRKEHQATQFQIVIAYAELAHAMAQNNESFQSVSNKISASYWK